PGVAPQRNCRQPPQQALREKGSSSSPCTQQFIPGRDVGPETLLHKIISTRILAHPPHRHSTSTLFPFYSTGPGEGEAPPPPRGSCRNSFGTNNFVLHFDILHPRGQ